jgi:hypothetical protein
VLHARWEHRLGRFWAVLAVILPLAFPALAEDDEIEVNIIPACDGAFDLCMVTCDLNNTGSFTSELRSEFCKGDCVDNLFACLPPSEARARRDRTKGQTGIQTGVFDPYDSIDDSDVFGISLVNSARVESACSNVAGALFSSTERAYGCLNSACGDAGAICLIYCANGKCFGGMPDKPASGLTLIGILQNGIAVTRGGAGSGGSMSGTVGGDAVDDSGGGKGEPACRVDCGPIL